VAYYSSADVERLLGVKNHVIRYWVDEIPLIQPKRDMTGRRQYSGRDIRILLRLKYLLYVRHLSIDEARTRLEEDLSGDQQDLRAELDALRSHLVNLYFSLSDTN
jgi:DNA-binding transcriptional MerR regulator